jgi:hypothetical protein
LQQDQQRVVEKVAELCHTAASRLLARQLPLSREEVANPNLVGWSFRIISWSVAIYQTNVVASSSLSPQAIMGSHVNDTFFLINFYPPNFEGVYLLQFGPALSDLNGHWCAFYLATFYLQTTTGKEAD